VAEFLDEGEVSKLLAAAKRIEQDIQWRRRQGYQTFSVDVLSPEMDYDMTLVGSVTNSTGYLKLNLFVGNQPIAMLHTGKQHHNPDCSTLKARAHKHTWTDAHREKFAYVPDDLDFSNVESLIRSFLKECNIELHGKLTTPAIQRRLW
jgi:hypothetical protein